MRFNDQWDTKMGDFEAHAEKLQAMLAERHQQELEASVAASFPAPGC